MVELDVRKDLHGGQPQGARAKTALALGAWYLLVFLFFFIWFSRVHPLVVYDADDWTYLAYARPATPQWGGWNPAKVFPEVLFPFFSSLGLYALMPLMGDYIATFTVTHALVVSFFITAYAWSFSGLIRRVFSLSRLTTSLMCLFFLSLHFLVFRVADSGNTHLFHCNDLNCYYNYLLPGLLNASLVMCMVNNDRWRNFLKAGDPVLKGCCYVVLYLAIFSNLVDSGILAAYAGSCLVLSLWDLLKTKRVLRPLSFAKQNGLSLWVLAAWFLSALFELSGGRADSAHASSIPVRLYLSVQSLWEALLGTNPLFWLCVCAITIASLICFGRSKQRRGEEATWVCAFLELFIAGAALLVYMIFLCASVRPDYFLRSEYLFPLFFYGLLLVLLALGYLFSKWPKLAALFPLLLLFLVSQINTSGKTFRESNPSDLSPEICAKISRDIVDQLITADRQGLTEMTLYVPVSEKEDGWPHTLTLMDRVGPTLYKQGIISRPIAVHPVASPELNERHSLPIPRK